jgi:SAM-dependent methyltransferase
LTTQAEYYLPRGYRSNPPASSDAAGTPFWEGGLEHNDVRYQAPVYRLAAREARRCSAKVVVDIGCGSGDKLARYFSGSAARVIGVDQESAIALARHRFPAVEWLSGDLETNEFWSTLESLQPDLVICADVIEHLVDPAQLLDRLRGLTGNGVLMLSTPDRSRLWGSQEGPPLNARHIREWSASELADFVRAHGFTILAHRHTLPRTYSPTLVEAKRLVYRALHRQAVPDRRSGQLLVLRSAGR